MGCPICKRGDVHCMHRFGKYEVHYGESIVSQYRTRVYYASGIGLQILQFIDWVPLDEDRIERLLLLA